MAGKKFFVVALVTLFTLGAASPAFADCCDSFFDCAAAVATEGISCAIQEFIDSIKDLVSFVQNLLDQASGATGDATRGAQAAVAETMNNMNAETKQNAEVLRATEAQGKQLASDEAQFKVLKGTTVASVPTTSDVNKPTAAPTRARPTEATKAASAPTAGSPGAMRAVIRNPNAATVPAAPPPPPPPSMTATLNAPGASVVPLAAPARAFMDEMNRASAELTKEKAAGDQEVTTVGNYMAQAQQSEGSGVKSANQIADAAVEAPFRNLLSQLTTLLTNPGDLTSPKSAIEAMANSIMSNLDVSISQIMDAITSGPNQAFQSAQPAYTQLQARAERCKAIASAMNVLYKDRTPAAANALNALLPMTANTSPAGLRSATLNTNLASHLVFTAAMSKFTASKQQVKATFLKRFDGLSTRMTKYEAVRAKVRTNKSSMTTYKTNFSTKLDSYMNGKTPAQITATRDSLVAEARTKFASDPKTRDAVINLLNSETAKRATMVRH